MTFVDPIPTLKEQLRLEILSSVGQYHQLIAADLLGIDQPRVCDLHKGKLERFSLEKLIRLLATIDRRVDLRVEDLSKGPLRTLRSRYR